MNRAVYVFDMDGTLTDSMRAFGQGMIAVLEEDGIEYPCDIVNTVTPLGYYKSAVLFSEMGAHGSVEEIVCRIEKNMVWQYTNNVALKEGVYDYLHALAANGARMFVLTASPHLVTDVCLKKNGVFDLFEKVWSVDDFKLTKSDTRIFQEVAKYIGCSMDDVNYFDDNAIALENSKKAGFITYAVRDMQSDEEIDFMKKNYIFVENFSTQLAEST